MNFESFVAKRYLRAKRKQAFIGVISIITLIGITLGVASLNIALAVHNGMRSAFLETLVGSSGMLFVKDSRLKSSGFTTSEINELTAVLSQTPGIAALSVQKETLCYATSYLKRTAGFNIKGIIPGDHIKVTPTLANLVQGDVHFLEGRPKGKPSGIIIGYDVARNLDVEIGDSLSIAIPQLSNPTFVLRNAGMKQKRFQVCGIFRTGSSDMDSFEAYVNLEDLMLWTNSSTIDQIQIKLTDLSLLDDIKLYIHNHELFSQNTTVYDLRDANRNLLKALALEKYATLIIISLIMMIAALNMVSALIMLVMEKNRDIGIMKSMGAAPRMIMGVFIRQGMTLSVKGTAIGTVLGVCISYWADWVKLIKLDSSVYEVLTYLPFKINWTEVLLIVAGSLLISGLSVLYPSRQAANLDPVEALRYE